MSEPQVEHSPVTIADAPGTSAARIDAVVIGAGMGGLYAVRRLRDDGLTVLGFEGANDVGGVWLHNGYPGARVDIEAYFYCFLDPQIYKNWRWTERFPAQAELLAYLRHYAEHYDLRRHFHFSTWVQQIHWDPSEQLWRIRTDAGLNVHARHVVLASGQLSKPRQLPFAGIDQFSGEWLETAQWPKRPVDLHGKRVAVIGTGSSGVQVITEVAQTAGSLHVFHRTPNYVVPSQNAPIDSGKYARYAQNLDEVLEQINCTATAYLAPSSSVPASDLTPEQQQERLERQWAFGGLSMTFAFPDQRTNSETNQLVSSFVRSKVRNAVRDPELARILEPNAYPIGTRRLVVCNGYYEVYNRENVQLVNLNEEDIVEITGNGIRTSHRDYEFDVIISAIGFDAFTGAIDDIDIRNAEGQRPSDFWTQGPSCYLGLMLHSFPNMYFLTGPGSPSVLVNFNVHNVFHADFVADLIAAMTQRGYTAVQPELTAQQAWRQRTAAAAEGLLRKEVDNYMVHVNEDGTRFMIPFAGGWSTYVKVVREIEKSGYPGFVFTTIDGDQHVLSDKNAHEGATASP